MLKPLAEALAAWSPQQSGECDPLARVTAAWPDVVGVESARNSQPLRIDGGTLVVATRSSAWSEQLSFLAERILASLRADFGLNEVQRLRFRVGRLVVRTRARVIRGAISRAARPASAPLHESADSESAFTRFRTGVGRVRRAKEESGWNQCGRCASLVPPGERAICAPCAVAISQDRERGVARLLFEVPWLGYSGIAAIVDGIEAEEYDAIRSRVLARWWDVLTRAARAKRVSRDRRERLLASSYVIVMSGLEPERIAPATMRNILGDDIFELLFEAGE